uniref:Uncharacterized protein n=1 Tax=Sphaerodactylus townsendi TaxID=933632 RepID=A0ACB8E6W0_9SAUR
MPQASDHETVDIRKFFGVVNVGKRHENDVVKNTDKLKNKEGEKSKSKEIKVKKSSPEEDSKQRQVTKKRRIIRDSDSEEEIQLVKKSKKSPVRKQSVKPDKILKKDPVVYVSETGLTCQKTLVKVEHKESQLQIKVILIYQL